MIQEKFAELSSYREEREGCLSLLFESRVLENDKQFAEYLVPRSERRAAEKSSNSSSLASLFQGAVSSKQSWPKPFAGCIARLSRSLCNGTLSASVLTLVVDLDRNHLGRPFPLGAHDSDRVGREPCLLIAILNTPQQAVIQQTTTN